MSGVEFEEENNLAMNSYRAPEEKESKMAKKLISWGVAQNESQANIVLVIVAVVVFGLAVYVAFK